jgi:hypothetical protein
MPDYRSMFDRDYIGAWDLKGKDVTVVITKVEARKLRNQKSQATKPIIFFEKAVKGFACNKTNGKTIAAMYGTDTDQWVGKAITIYATTTSFGSETVECIRVRPGIPKRGAAEQSPPIAAPPEATPESESA